MIWKEYTYTYRIWKEFLIASCALPGVGALDCLQVGRAQKIEGMQIKRTLKRRLFFGAYINRQKMAKNPKRTFQTYIFCKLNVRLECTLQIHIWAFQTFIF